MVWLELKINTGFYLGTIIYFSTLRARPRAALVAKAPVLQDYRAGTISTRLPNDKLQETLKFWLYILTSI